MTTINVCMYSAYLYLLYPSVVLLPIAISSAVHSLETRCMWQGAEQAGQNPWESKRTRATQDSIVSV